MSVNNNGRETTYGSNARRKKNGGYDGGNFLSRPVAIPNDQTTLYEHTPLLQHSSSTLSKSSSPTKRMLSSCQPTVNNSPWGTNEYLHFSSPMVSGPRNSLRLPNLDLREARRQSAIAAANARLRTSKSVSSEFPSNHELSRSRSASLGSAKDRARLSYAKLVDEEHDSPLLLGEAIRKRRTPSGLSLMDLSGTIIDDIEMPSNQHDDNKHDDSKVYAAAEELETTTDSMYTQHLDKTTEDEETNSKTITQSQSCTIHDLNPTPPTPKSSLDTDDSLLQELKEEFETQSNPPILSLLYGLVNTSIVLPILMSFGSIIYHDDFFRPYLSVLMKLTVVSGAVHQITFSTVSSLPFAVGQVQDAGLIFLSSMARDLVSRLKVMGVDDASILATVTIGLSLYTAVLGCALILVGKFRLASYCQLLPPSVVGGYLAYIGFFCGQAGLVLMASVDVNGLGQWYKFLDGEALMLLLPGVIGGCSIYYSVRTFRHMSVLPSCILMLMVVFYAILWSTNTTIQDATDNGWINKTVKTGSWYHMWDFLRIQNVVWSVLPTQTLTVLAMISVVALSSSLDIAAIEIELKRPLDYNHELKTVGISNIISGITGGYTGSYIFSQTIFSLRMGIRSRLMGYVLAFLSLFSVVIPINILSYIPNFFFGSLLMMICLDLMFEWLIDVRAKVSAAEYVVLLSTFALLQIVGVEFGIMAGCCIYFVIKKMGYNLGSEQQLNEDEQDMKLCETPR